MVFRVSLRRFAYASSSTHPRTHTHTHTHACTPHGGWVRRSTARTTFSQFLNTERLFTRTVGGCDGGGLFYGPVRRGGGGRRGHGCAERPPEWPAKRARVLLGCTAGRRTRTQQQHRTPEHQNTRTTGQQDDESNRTPSRNVRLHYAIVVAWVTASPKWRSGPQAVAMPHT